MEVVHMVEAALIAIINLLLIGLIAETIVVIILTLLVLMLNK